MPPFSLSISRAFSEASPVWNGADFYGAPTNNSLHLMNRYFTRYPEDADKVVLCIKTGFDPTTFTIDSSPSFLRSSAASALAILDGKKKIDVFGPGRVDGKTPVEESVAICAELMKEGKIGGIQLSEVRADSTLR